MTDVLLDARIISRGHTGIARYVRELAARMGVRGVHLDALVPKGATLKGARNLHVRSPFLSPFEQLELPVRVVRWRGFQRRRVFWVPAYDVPLAAPGPLVVTVHDANHLALPGPNARLHAQYYRTVVRPACERAKFVLVPSEFAKREVLERIASIDPAKIVVTPLGIHTPQRPDSTLIDRARTSLGLPGKYVAYLGNFKAHKNLDTLLAAAAAFSGDAPLVLIGGREAELGDALTRARKAGADVRVIPALPDDELWPVMAGASVFAFPSRYEGFGLPPLEAMALGVPVVSSTAGSLLEVVDDAALTVEPDDASTFGREIVRVLSDDALASELSRKGLKRAASFTWDRCADQTARVLEQASES